MTLAGVALAAGEGARLRPLTGLRPKALCPVGGRPLVDLALDRLAALVGTGSDRLAVNAHHHADQIRAHFDADPGRARVEVEHPEALGTAGAVAGLRLWLDGRDVLLTNADSYLPDGLTGFADGLTDFAGGLTDFADDWDGERCRLLCRVLPPEVRPDFVDRDGTGLRYVGACLLPWARVRDLKPIPTGLYEVLWRDDDAAGALDLVRMPEGRTAIDCGTPADYLAANLYASGGQNVIGTGATVLGRLERSVVWDGAWVGPDEVLVDQIRAGDREHPVTVNAASRP